MEGSSENDPLLAVSGDGFSPSRRKPSESQYVVYSWRWFMLFVWSLLSFTNGVMWIMFSPIADITANFYHISADQVNWLSLSYMAISIPMGFVAMWALDTKSLKKLLHLCAWLNVIGAGVRLMSIMTSVSHVARYPVLLTGQCISAMSQPFLLFGTTRLCALWFPDKERAAANAVASMANPLGILLANVISPLIATTPGRLFWMLEASAVPACAGLFLTYMVVTSDRPPTPPSASAEQPSMGFLPGLKKVVRNKNYLILCASIGTGIAVSSVLSTLMEQMLCPRGYSNEFSGLCVALMFGVGILSAMVAGVIVDKTRKFVEVIKICFSLCVIALVAFALVSRQPGREVVLAILISCVGMLGFPALPVGLEVAVECTYPVSEGTSAGFLQISGQLQSAISVIVLQLLTRPYHGNTSVCHVEGPTGVLPEDYTVPMLVLCGLGVVAAVCLVIFFRCEFRRLQAEGALVSERLVTGDPPRRGATNSSYGTSAAAHS